MPASPASVSSDKDRPRLLIVGLNWLGDAVMSMPAVGALRARHPEATLTMLARPAVAALWTLFPGVDRVVTQVQGPLGTFRTGAALRDAHYTTAWVFPKSFRSALLARLSGARECIGLAGHWRDAMLTRVVPLPKGDTRHQRWEYLDLVNAIPDRVAQPPFIVPPEADLCAVRREQESLGGGDGAIPWVAFFPGAARGPSKCWPAERFAEVARRLCRDQGCRVVVCGSGADRAACAAVAAGAGGGAVDLAGRTTLHRLAAWLSLCRGVVANDSGGMHLAAALGVPVVAVFGVTDPARTGPLGAGHCVIAAEGVVRSRTVAADSLAARTALLSIAAGRVYDAAAMVLERTRAGSF
jgi:heptosyltransferase-2